jgi:hypothetical protein
MMSAWSCRRVRAAKRSCVRAGVVLAGAAVLAGGVLASPVAAATVPRPAAGLVPGMSTAASGAVADSVRAFYQQAGGSLALVQRTASSGWASPQDLGGVLSSGPASAVATPCPPVWGHESLGTGRFLPSAPGAVLPPASIATVWPPQSSWRSRP